MHLHPKQKIPVDNKKQILLEAFEGNQTRNLQVENEVFDQQSGPDYDTEEKVGAADLKNF